MFVFEVWDTLGCMATTCFPGGEGAPGGSGLTTLRWHAVRAHIARVLAAVQHGTPDRLTHARWPFVRFVARGGWDVNKARIEAEAANAHDHHGRGVRDWALPYLGRPRPLRLYGSCEWAAWWHGRRRRRRVCKRGGRGGRWRLPRAAARRDVSISHQPSRGGQAGGCRLRKPVGNLWCAWHYYGALEFSPL